MPLDPDDILAEGRAFIAEERTTRRNGTGAHAPEEDFAGLFRPVPAGARNTTLTRLVGYLRAKRVDYPAGRFIARQWNAEFCRPPMDDAEVEDLAARAWAEWTEGTQPDAKPEDFQEKPQVLTVELLTSDDLLEMGAAGAGLKWLVPNVLVEGGVHIISAPAAGAKSWLCLDLCRALASGGVWLGQYDLAQTPVLYWDEEMGKHAAASRVQKLGFPRGLPFYYLPRNGLKIIDAAARKEIANLIRSLKAGLLVVDTVTGVFPGLKENEAEHVSRLRAFFREFTEAGATVLVLHHDRKGGAGDSSTPQDRMAGSRDFAAMADMAYGIDKRGEVFHVAAIKNRHLPEEDELSVDFVLEDNEQRTTVTIRSLGEGEKMQVSRAKSGKRLRYAITDALMGGALKTAELCAAVKGSPNAVLAEAKAMVEEGLLVTEKAAGSGGGVFYSLPPD